MRPVHPGECPPILLPGFQDGPDPPQRGAEGLPGLRIGMLPPEEPAEEIAMNGPIAVRIRR